MKEIDIYARGSANYMDDNRVCYYALIMSYKGYEKKLSKIDHHKSIEDMLEEGIVRAIEQLKEPCAITVHTHCQLSKKRRKGISVEVHLNGGLIDFVVSDERQEDLSEDIHNLKLGHK